MANKKPGARQPLSRARPRAVSKPGLSVAQPRSLSALKKKLSATTPARNIVRRKRRPPADPATVYERLTREYPRAQCALVHDSPYQLIVATILSAQCTDARVNLVTPRLFATYPRASDLADADPTELEQIIQSTGFFRNKSRSLIGMASAVVAEHQGEIPDSMEELFQLPGVGRAAAHDLCAGRSAGTPHHHPHPRAGDGGHGQAYGAARQGPPSEAVAVAGAAGTPGPPLARGGRQTAAGEAGGRLPRLLRARRVDPVPLLRDLPRRQRDRSRRISGV